MSTVRVADALRTLARDPDPPADGDLVTRFADRRDEAAFAELIRRHGPTVYGVCRRVLGHAHDAEDAFQAVWLVLARRAGDVHPPGSVGNFLYGVAVRTATKARSLAAKRRQRLMSAAKPEPVVDPPADSDLRAVLDEELGRLPDKLRAAVVLCDLNGKSRSAAAAELGWPEGTVAARQAKGRTMLADRLRRRGVALSAAALAAALAPEATAASVPAALAHDALAAALGWAAVPPSARLLAEGVMRSMSVARWKLPAALVMAVGLAGGVVLAARPAPEDPPARRAAEKLVAPADEPAKPAAGGWKEAAVLKLAGWLAGSVTYSPDGQVLLVGGTNGQVQAFDTATRKELWTYKDETGHFAAVAYSRSVAGKDDGAEIAVTFKDGVRFLDAKSGKVKDTLTEPGSAPIAVGYFRDKLPGGNIDATVRHVVFGDARGYHAKSWLKWPQVGGITVATTQPGKEPADPFAVPLAVDPRGRAETHAVMTGPIDRDTGKNVLWAYACGGPGGNKLLDGHTAAVTAATWSADGSTIVTGDADGVVIVWDAATFKEKAKVGFDRRVAALTLTVDGSRVAAAVIANDQIEGTAAPSYWELVHVWEPGKPKADAPVGKAGPFGGPFQGTAGLAFSPNGKELAAAYANFDHLTKLGDLTGTVRVWRLAEADKPAPAPTSWKGPRTLPDHGGRAAAVAWAPDGSVFATGGADGMVTIRDAKALKVVLRFQPNTAPVNTVSHKVHALAYSPDGKFLAVSHRDGVSLHEAKTGAVTSFPGRKGPIDSGPVMIHPYAVAFSSKGNLFASLSAGNGLRIIDTVTGEDMPWPRLPRGPYPAQPDAPPKPDRDGAAPRSTGIDPPIECSLAFSPDGTKLASAATSHAVGQVTRVEVVEARTGKSLGRLVGNELVRDIAWSPDGSKIATAGVGALMSGVWDATTFKQVREFELLQGYARGLAFSPDGTTLVVGEYMPVEKGLRIPQPVSRVRVEDVATGKWLELLPLAPDDHPSAVAVSPDGSRLVVVSGNAAGKGQVRVWERAPAK